MRIKIKVKHTHLSILAECLMDYANVCSLNNIANGEQWDFDFLRVSIATKLYHDVQKHIYKRYPSEKQSFKFEVHEAIVLLSACLEFIYNESETYQKNIIEQIKNDLHFELTNQLLTANTL